MYFMLLSLKTLTSLLMATQSKRRQMFRSFEHTISQRCMVSQRTLRSDKLEPCTNSAWLPCRVNSHTHSSDAYFIINMYCKPPLFLQRILQPHCQGTNKHEVSKTNTFLMSHD